LREFCTSILGDYACRKGRKRWVDKTPSYYRMIDLIEKIFDRQVQFIVLVRHPLDTIASLDQLFKISPRHNDPDIARISEEAGRDCYAWASYWCDVYARCNFYREGDNERWVVVRYEDLVIEPQREMMRLCSFLGEEYEDGLVERVFTTAHDRGYQDPKIQGTHGIHQHSVRWGGGWPRGEAQALWRTVGSTADAYGYSLHPGETCRGQ